MTFVKGQSGNPNGRPKKRLPDGRTLSDVAREHTEDAINTLVEIMRDGDSDSARHSAACSLLDRAWGRPSQAVEVTGEDGGAVLIDMITRKVVDNG